MDETPLTFDSPESYTLNKKGEDTIHIRTNGADKRGFTVVLTCTADGGAVTPHIVFKGVRALGEACPHPGIHARVNPRGWMNEEVCRSAWSGSALSSPSTLTSANSSCGTA